MGEEVQTRPPEVEQPAEPPVLPPQMVAVPVPPSPGLTRLRRAALFVVPVAAVLLSWGAGYGLFFLMKAEPPQPAAVADAGPPDGARLYAFHCAHCHGERGDGRGPAPLDPPARHFGAEKFKLGTTDNPFGPTDDDLVRVLARGIPGSAMPAFGHLPEAELRAIVGHVRELTRNGVYAQLRAKEIEDFGDYDALEIAEKTAARTRPGKPLEVPVRFTEPTPEVLARGRMVYLQSCAPCHGPEGRGDGPQVKDLRNDNGTPALPRDLTQGLYKGGDEPEQLYARIVLGIPGTPMPATNTLPPDDLTALIAYVRSLARQPQDASAVAGR